MQLNSIERQRRGEQEASIAIDLQGTISHTAGKINPANPPTATVAGWMAQAPQKFTRALISLVAHTKKKGIWAPDEQTCI